MMSYCVLYPPSLSLSLSLPPPPLSLSLSLSVACSMTCEGSIGKLHPATIIYSSDWMFVVSVQMLCGLINIQQCHIAQLQVFQVFLALTEDL